MKRNLGIIFRPEVYGYLKYILPAITRVKNWPKLLMNYGGLRNKADTYKMRNGMVVKTGDTVDSATVLLICLKKDYGDAPKDSVIIDIGANIGVYSVYSGYGTKSRVYAYEPMSSAYKLLEENIRLNDLGDRVKAFACGVAAERGHQTLNLGTSSVYNSMYEDRFTDMFSGESEKIECIRLQDIFEDNSLDHCDLLKMDCEGAEFEAFYSLPKDYFGRIKEIRMEFHNIRSKDKHNHEDLIKFLEGQGFEVTNFEKHPKKEFGNVWLKNTKFAV
jgi:FkbM family methyltransferase